MKRLYSSSRPACRLHWKVMGISFQEDCLKAAWDKGFLRIVTVDAGHYHNFSYRSFFASYRKLYIKTITDRHHIVGALMNTGVSRHGSETIVLKKSASSSSKRFSPLQWKVKDRKPSCPPEQRMGPAASGKLSFQEQGRKTRMAQGFSTGSGGRGRSLTQLYL